MSGSASTLDKTFIPLTSAKLARTHKLMRIEREKEIQFLKICSQIRLNDFKKTRSDHQREERRLKRSNIYPPAIAE
jgi:hypothetical protein